MKYIREKHIIGRTTLASGRGVGEISVAPRVCIAHLLLDRLEKLCCQLARTTANNTKVKESRDDRRYGRREGGIKGGQSDVGVGKRGIEVNFNWCQPSANLWGQV